MSGVQKTWSILNAKARWPNDSPMPRPVATKQSVNPSAMVWRE